MNYACCNSGYFLQIDGLGSHSYPNPAFAQPPTKQDAMSIASYRYELNLIQQLGGKNLPIFITETGWSTEKISPFIASLYMQTAFTTVWADANVVALLPSSESRKSFLFSFLNADNSPTPQYTLLRDLPKTKGAPQLAPAVLGERIPKIKLEEKVFSQESKNIAFAIPKSAKTALKWFLKMPLE
jgi:hypothetical protein